MDASTPPEKSGPAAVTASSAEVTGGTVHIGRQRRFAVLAVVLAAAVTLPLAVHSAQDQVKPTPPTAKTEPLPRPLTTAEAAREARRTGKDVEVTAERTANSTTWAQPDGWMRIRTHSDTIRAKVGGEWKKIDTRLKRVEGGYAPSAVNDPLLFSAGTAALDKQRASRTVHRTALAAAGPVSDDGRAWNELVRLTAKGHDLIVSWPGPLPAPVVDGPRALYENVRPGIDLLLTARDSGYSHILIVHTPQAAKDPLLADLDYRLTSPTLGFKLDADSHVVSALDAEGEEMAVAPTPYQWDSAGTVMTTIGEASPSPAPEASGTALTLPGLAGPQPGSHESALGASLDDAGVLNLAVKDRFLQDPDTVYPVFIDPSFKGHKRNWTLLYAKEPDSSFLNGQNFNDGTNEARVGYESTTQGLSRSVFNFEHDAAKLRNAVVKSSFVRMLQTYSWGCAAEQYNLYLTGLVTSTNTWNKPPSWGRFLRSQTNGHGYKAGSCPDKWVGTDITSTAQEAATNGWTAIGIGLRAANESNSAAWKKFMANGESSPYIETIFNHKPDEPKQSEMKLTPGGTCDTSVPFPSIGKSDIRFSVKGRDADDNLKYVHLKVWRTGYPDNAVIDANYTPAGDGVISVLVPWGSLSNGTYSWSAWTIDTENTGSSWGPAGTTAYCQFVVDQTAPSSPLISSAQFPPPGDNKNQWSTVEFGTAGTFSFSTDVADGPLTLPDYSVVRYEYSLNTNNYTINPPITTAMGTIKSTVLKPPTAGVNTLYAWTVDAAGNRSQPAKYVFFVTPRKVLDPPGDLTGDSTPDLLAIDNSGNLRNYPAEPDGNVNIHLPGGYNAAGELDDGYWGNGTNHALISHSGDWYPGDGINDIMARMPDGKLYLYPGDGYGSFNTDERLDVLLPPGSPSSAALTELTLTSDITGDGLPDMFAVAGDQLWAFTGYTGGSFTSARLLSPSAWAGRDIVTVADITGDKVADLLFRTEETGRGLLLRHGKAAGPGVDLNSLAAAVNSATGKDEVYGTGGWNRAGIPMIKGTLDVNSDTIPDLWAVLADGTLRFYRGGTTSHGTHTLVGEGGWTTLLTLG
ncbi:FG-GAP-like repeat-containing protein [Streptomyces sp. NPDC058548]|uniref:FG-GAP-like repeat-containing protein n=1 Tax=Streptomyces sp. NPDC058548 TaxID=3346545 RepID=UPI003665A555